MRKITYIVAAICSFIIGAGGFLGTVYGLSLFSNGNGVIIEQSEAANDNDGGGNDTSPISVATEGNRQEGASSRSLQGEPMPFDVAPSSIGDMSITPLANTDDGIMVDTAFKIITSFNASIEALKDYLVLGAEGKAPVAFSLEDMGDNEFLLTPETALEKEAIYRIKYEPPEKHPLSFAFQTEAGFRVVSTLPAQNSYNVLADTGISISFSNTIQGELSQYFYISPFVTGRWERVGDTHFFIPSGLSSSTTYTINIIGGEDGVKDIDGNTLDGDYVFTFTTQWSGEREAYCNIFGEIYETFFPYDNIFFELSASQEFAEVDFTVDVYQIPDAVSFIEGGEVYPLLDNAPEGYTLLETFNTYPAVMNIDMYNTRYFIPTGQTYGPGYYLFDISASYGNRDFSMQKWIQVSDISVFSLSVGGDIALWVNDVSTGRPAAGAEVVVDSQRPAATNSDGTVVIPISSSSISSPVYVNVPGHNTFVFAIRTYDEREKEPQRRYYSYIYTDRSAYLPKDTIRIFGAVNPRSNEFLLRPGDDIVLRLGDMIEIPVSLDGYGSFEALINVNALYGYETLGLYINGDFITSRSLIFMEYDRDGYIMNGSTDRNVYLLNEPVGIDINVTTFDGSPVEGLTLSGSYMDTLTMHTNWQGMASGTVYADTWSYDGLYDWRPEYQYRWFTVTSADEYLQSVTVPFVVMPSRYMFEVEDIDETTMVFTTHTINRDALEDHIASSGSDYFYGWGYEDVYRGEPIDLDFRLVINKSITTRVQTDEYYDYIQNRNVPVYRYETNTELYAEHSLRTVNGTYVFTEVPIHTDPMVSYSGEVFFDGGNGATIRTNLGIYRSRYIDYYNTIPNFWLNLTERPETPDTDNLWSLRANETGVIALSYSGLDVDYLDGLMLVIPVTEKIEDIYTGDPAGAGLTFLPDYINNVNVFGAYFDGKRVYRVSYPAHISYDSSENELSFDISFNKDVYAPGETVSGEIKVTDAAGNPVQTMVNISVVDEAVLRQNPNSPSFTSYFQGAYNQAWPYSIYTSYIPRDESGLPSAVTDAAGGAEMGGDGGDYNMRQDFSDNPAFITIETNAGGNAEFSFDLSDSVTMWRISLNGISGRGEVGDETFNIVATLPFYINLIMTETFLEGDDLALSVRPRGEMLEFNQTMVAYNAELETSKEIIPISISDNHSLVNFNFGAMPVGDYTVRIYAEAQIGGTTYKDAMEDKIRVVADDIRINLRAKHTIDAENPVIIPAYEIIASPVRVLITNGDIGPMMDILQSTVDNGSMRTDYMAGTAFAEAFWEREPGEEIIPRSSRELSNVLQSNWGIPEMAYGTPDLLYTVRFLAAFPELVNASYIRGYIMQNAGFDENSWARPNFDSESEEAMHLAAGYMGRAALGDVVLLEIYSKINEIYSDANQAQYTEVFERHMQVLYYAAALCIIGDDTAAANLVSAYAAHNDAWHNDTAESHRRGEFVETMILFVETTTDPVSAFNYLKSKTERNTYVSDVCERINFIKKAVPLSGIESEIRYTLNGETHTLTLVNYDCLYLSVDKEQFEALNIVYISGRTTVDVYYNGDAASLDPDSRALRLSKEITPVAGHNNIYKVTLTLLEYPDEDSPWRSYTIYDRIPSNMRFTRPNFLTRSVNTYIRAERQRVVLWTFTWWGEDINNVFEYYVVKVNNSNAIIPNAYILNYSTAPPIWGVSP